MLVTENSKRGRPWSDRFFRSSSLIWVCAICLGLYGKQLMFKFLEHLPQLKVLFVLILYVPVNDFSVMSEQVFLGWTSTKQRKSCSTTQHSASGEARTHIPSIWSQALFHWASP